MSSNEPIPLGHPLWCLWGLCGLFGHDQAGCLRAARAEEPTLPRPIPIYGPFIQEKQMELLKAVAAKPATEIITIDNDDDEPEKPMTLLPQLSLKPKENVLYTQWLPLVLQAFESHKDDLLSFCQIFRQMKKLNDDVIPAKNLLHYCIKRDDHHFHKWHFDVLENCGFRLGKGAKASVYYSRHPLSHIVINIKKGSSITYEKAFRDQNITPGVFSKIRQGDIPTSVELKYYIDKYGRRFCYPEDLNEYHFLRTHLVEISPSTGGVNFIPFSTGWQAPTREMEPEPDEILCKQFLPKLELAIQRLLGGYVKTISYKKMVIITRRTFREVDIHSFRAVMEKIVEESRIITETNRNSCEGAVFKLTQHSPPPPQDKQSSDADVVASSSFPINYCEVGKLIIEVGGRQISLGSAKILMPASLSGNQGLLEERDTETLDNPPPNKSGETDKNTLSWRPPCLEFSLMDSGTAQRLLPSFTENTKTSQSSSNPDVVNNVEQSMDQLGPLPQHARNGLLQEELQLRVNQLQQNILEADERHQTMLDTSSRVESPEDGEIVEEVPEEGEIVNGEENEKSEDGVATPSVNDQLQDYFDILGVKIPSDPVFKVPIGRPPRKRDLEAAEQNRLTAAERQDAFSKRARRKPHPTDDLFIW